MEQRSSAAAALEHLTSEVRRLLRAGEDEPVGVATYYRDALLKLCDAVDTLADEIDSRSPPRSG